MAEAAAGIKVAIASMIESHWERVRAIYQAGIDPGHATFASAPPANWAAWEAGHLNEFSLVALEADQVIG